MRHLILSSLLVFAALGLQAQDRPPAIHLHAEGEVEVPADLIRFHIQINASADSPQGAYKLHTQREERLVELLEQYRVDEEDIRYRPVSLSRAPDRTDTGTPPVQTRQQVVLTLRDFDAFEQIQVGLIEAGYDRFSADFATSRADSARDVALREAVARAREKAEIIASEAHVRLGNIVSIDYGEPRFAAGSETMRMSADAGPGGMMRYEQTVSITASVSVSFAIRP